jgi:hypothetical protein
VPVVFLRQRQCFRFGLFLYSIMVGSAPYYPLYPLGHTLYTPAPLPSTPLTVQKRMA